MESQKSQNFNERLGQWVASQGFWFQLRHSAAGNGSQAMGSHLLQLGARVLVFLLVLALVGWILLVRRTESRSYQREVEASIGRSIGARETEMGGFKRSGGQLAITRFAGTGGENAFFDSLDAGTIKCDMSVLDTFERTWETGVLNIGRLHVQMRAGADDAAAAARIGEAIFREYGRVKVSSVRIADFSMNWGFSDQTKGGIEGAKARLERVPGGWKVDVAGGKFSQNWLKNFEIVSLSALCKREGITFSEAKFSQGGGELELTDFGIKGGAAPVVEATAVMKSVPLGAVLPSAAQNLLEGRISGKFKVTGSLNTTGGVQFEGVVEIADGDKITMVDRVHLLRALTAVDVFNGYRRVDFKEGTFHLKAGGGKLELSKIDLKAGELVGLKGEMAARRPTQEEAQALINRKELPRDDSFDFRVPEDAPDVKEIAMRKAASEARGEEPKNGPKKPQDRLAEQLEKQRIANEAAERAAATMLYEGQLEMSLNPQVFEGGEQLKKEYPVDPASNRVRLEVPIAGQLYELTLPQAEYIYKNGRR